jgi:hypothetical protein
MSSTTVNNGANLIERRHMLYVYVNAEGVASCGGNNVASLLIKNLHDSELLIPIKGLISLPLSKIAMVGTKQFVLKILCAWIIEKCFFTHKGVCCLPCQVAHQEPLWPGRRTSRPLFEDLLEILNKSDEFVATEVMREDFHDWTTMFKELYTGFPAVLKYHLFESTDIKYVSMKVGDGHVRNLQISSFQEKYTQFV